MHTQPKASAMAAHTPGPWMLSTRQVVGSAYCQLHVIPEYPGDDICRVGTQDSQSDGGRDIALESANARLIAAAPELLAALHDLGFSRYQITDKFTAAHAVEAMAQAARTAYFKAKGQS